MEDNLKYLILLFPAVGFFLLFAGIVRKHQLKQKVVAFIRIPGVVTGFNSGIDHYQSGVDGIIYHPIVEYHVDGTAYSATSAVGYRKPKEEGSRMDILYDRSSPSTAYVVKGYYFAPHMMIAIGIMFLLMGSCMACQLL